MLQPDRIGRNDVSEREFFLLRAPRISDVPSTLGLSSKYFGVLLACDARDIDDRLVADLARSLIAKGMRYFCSWGGDCERVHEFFDSVIVENDPHGTEDSVIMTMWLNKGSLDEALWHFLYVSFPANDYWEACKADLAIVIGNDKWGDQVKMRLSDLSGLNTHVVGDNRDCEPAT